MKVDVNLLKSIKQAEEMLAENEKKEPDLPPGHPILIANEQAKRRMELAKQLQEKQKTKKKSKKKSRKKAAEEQQKEEELKKKMELALSLNKRLDEMAQGVVKLAQETEKIKTEFKEHPYVRTRIGRLERMMMAFHRGLLETKLNSRHVEQYEGFDNG